MKNKFQAGQSLVELLVVIGLSAIILPALFAGLMASREGKAQQGQRAQAITVLNQTIEAVRSVREKGWSYIAAIPLNNPYHPVISNPTWSLVSGESPEIDGFKTKVEINSVNRGDCPGADCGKIVTTAGTLDPSTKKVVVTISWVLPYVSSISETLYMTRYLDNNAFTQTLGLQTPLKDFDLGTKTGTTVTNVSGGEVTLGAGGQRDWCAPNLSIAPLDLPKNGVANALTAIEGYAFAGTGDNASGVSFARVNIGNANPPAATLGYTFDGYKTNGVFGETNYAYLATDKHSKEIVIIDLNNVVGGKYQEVGYFDAPGNGDGNSVFVSGNIGYMTSDNKLYSFDLSSKSGSRPLRDPDGLTLLGTGKKIFVVNNYAYLAIEDSTYEMQIVDVSNPDNLIGLGRTNVDPTDQPGSEDGQDIFVNQTGTRAYVVVDKYPTLSEFFIIDVTTKTGNPPLVGEYDTSDMNPKGVAIVPGNKAIVVGTGGEEYQVINIANENSPAKCGGVNIDTGVNGVSSVLELDGDAYSYIITGDANAEFKIIEGGPGGQYASSGEFVSSTFDPGYQTAFNRFEVSVNSSFLTDIKFHIALSDAVGGSCDGASFTFVGPDGTSSTFFTTAAAAGTQVFSYIVPTSLNLGRCFKYKAYFSTTDAFATPIFYDFIMNFSP